jgi:hypothetical protein
MNGVGNDRRELARGVYEQHNESIRHLENQRLWFTLVYLFLYGGALAFIPEGLYPDADWLGIGFVAVVSLFGLLFVIDIQRSLSPGHAAAAVRGVEACTLLLSFLFLPFVVSAAVRGLPRALGRHSHRSRDIPCRCFLDLFRTIRRVAGIGRRIGIRAVYFFSAHGNICRPTERRLSTAYPMN